MKGSPYFHYKIPYGDWYIILTKEGEHFYFNESKKVSYWQLHDVFENHQEISKEAFIKSINFDDVGILIAKCNGFKGIEDFYLIHEGQKENHHEAISQGQHNESEKETAEPVGERYELESENEDSFSHKEDALEVNDPNGGKTPGGGSGLFSGYSSSSESEDNDNEDVRENEVDFGIRADTIESSNPTEGDDVLVNNDGLDLLLSEEEDEEYAKTEFFKLLDMYIDKILVYEPWFVVEEELLPEFSKNPEYFSVASSVRRENFFNEWCSMKQQVIERGTTKSTNSSTASYPSAIQKYYKLLQNTKSQVKKLQYNDFKIKYARSLENFSNTSSKEKEEMFHQYRVMIMDYPEYEKRMKKFHPEANCKKLKLETFLKENLPKDPSTNILTELMSEILNSVQDDFNKWADVCNIYEVPKAIANNVCNFILGDEKRLSCYIEFFNT